MWEACVMSSIRRIYVEKKPAFAIEAKGLLEDLRTNLGMAGLQSIRLLNRYDVMGLSEEEFSAAKNLVLSEPQVDNVSDTLAVPQGCHAFAVELLPGQYDQREDFSEQCIQLITQKERPLVAAATIYLLEGSLSAAEIAAIKHYCINPVEAREAAWERPQTLENFSLEPE